MSSRASSRDPADSYEKLRPIETGSSSSDDGELDSVRELQNSEVSGDGSKDVSDELLHQACVGAGKAVRLLMRVENSAHCSVERESVYGSAIALPQIARSVEWPTIFLVLVIRTVAILMINYFIQGALIYLIFQESLVMDILAGQMHLCSFGASFEQCPNSENCVGPGGTEYTKYNLQGDFGDWSARIFVRDALIKLFPNMQEEIVEKVDPGEYGLESSLARWVCVVLFLFAIVDDLKKTMKMFRLIWQIPTRADPWIGYEPATKAERIRIKELRGVDEDSFIKFKVAGMPLPWKLLNFMTIIVPKFLIWFFLAMAGIKFLMETAEINDLILNSMAMAFILDIDELLAARLWSAATVKIMESIEDFPSFDLEDLANEEDEDALHHLAKDKKRKGPSGKGVGHYSMRIIWTAFPVRLCLAVLSLALFCFGYFWVYCDCSGDLHAFSGDTCISKPIYAPLNVKFKIWNALFGTMQYEEPATWQMPDAEHPVLIGAKRR